MCVFCRLILDARGGLVRGWYHDVEPLCALPYERSYIQIPMDRGADPKSWLADLRCDFRGVIRRLGVRRGGKGCPVNRPGRNSKLIFEINICPKYNGPHFQLARQGTRVRKMGHLRAVLVTKAPGETMFDYIVGVSYDTW